MGFVDDDTDTEAEDGMFVSDEDEEAHPASSKESAHFGHARRLSSPNDLRTPTTKDDDLLNVTRLRRKGITESEEIWEELEDDSIRELSPSTWRRSSVWSTPSSRTGPGGPALDHTPDETTALLARSSTGRSYRDKRRRRSSHVLPNQERESRRVSTMSQEALGGWWKMKRWWKGKRDKGKIRGDDTHSARNGA